MRPTGKLHLGNYMGALHNWVRLQDEYECYCFIADWHALTTDYADPSQLPANTREVMIDYLAAGLDPERSVLFVQSDVKVHAEFHLLLSMITPLGWLERVPSYKEQQENLTGRDLSTYGFLGYPLLQAADILIYQADFVPVGQDQVAHVELTREVARRFNQFYKRPNGSEILPEPRSSSPPRPNFPAPTAARCRRATATPSCSATPSPKSAPSSRPWSPTPRASAAPIPATPTNAPSATCTKFSPLQEILAKVYAGCTTAGIGCIECKSWAADAIVSALAPIQERRVHFEQHPALVTDIFNDGARRATARAEQTMHEVRSAMGLDSALPGTP